MDLGLKGKIALVTGTGSPFSMGRTISLTLAKEGCDIVSCDIDGEGAQRTADEVKALGRKAIAIKVDVANKAEVDAMAEAALKEFGKIDVLVNTVGLIARPGMPTFFETTPKDWEKDINVNFYGTMNCCHAVAPSMIEKKDGKIINFASIAAENGGGSYPSAKAAVVSITKGLAREFGTSGVRVNAIAPMVAPTDFAGGSVRKSPERQQAMGQGSAFKRINTVEEIADVVLFLASDMSRGVTGDMIRIGYVH